MTELHSTKMTPLFCLVSIKFYKRTHNTNKMFSKGTRYILLLFQIFGLSPFRINFLTNTPCRNIHMIIYTGILIILSFILLISGYLNPHIIPNFEDIARYLSDFAVFILAFVTLFVVLFQSILTCNEQIKLLVLCGEIDFILTTQLNYHIDHKRLAKSVIIPTIYISLCYVIQEGLTFYTLLEVNKYLVYWLHLIFAIVVVAVKIVQFIFYIDMLQKRLLMLNICVKRMVEPKTLISHYFDEEFMISSENLEQKLESIKIVFKKLVKVHRLCIRVLGTSMMFVVLEIYFFLCTNTYWSILQHTSKTSSIFPYGTQYIYTYFFLIS